MDSLHPVDRNSAIALFGLSEQVAFHNHVLLYECRVRRKEGRWLAILKATNRGKFLVAFVAGDSFYGVLLNVGQQSADANIYWQPDGYPPDWAVKQFPLPL